MRLSAFLQELRDRDEFEDLATEEVSQFGANQEYLGAQILPENQVDTPNNVINEEDVRYVTVIGNASDRYSPAQKVGGGRYKSSVTAELGESDIAQDFSGQDFDDVARTIQGAESMDMEAAAEVLGWAEETLNAGLIEVNEKQRWDAIINAQVVRKSRQGTLEKVDYLDPSGHRVTAGGDWSSDSYDPFSDIMAGIVMLRDKGFEPTLMVTSTAVLMTLLGNRQIARRMGSVNVVRTGDTDFSEYQQLIQAAELNQFLGRDELPAIQTYDLRYHTGNPNNPRARFFPKDAFVIFGETGRSEEIESAIAPENLRVVEETLGYVGVGRPVGRSRPGRAINVEAHEDKPPRLEGEAWQSSLPIITEPEAMYVISGINYSWAY